MAILPITVLYYEAVWKLMLDVHSNSAPSNIMKLFVRTSNNYTVLYTTCSSVSQLVRIKYSRCQNLEWDAKWIEKFVKEILQKRNKSSSQYSRGWRFLYQAWWDYGYKFKHGKIETNWTCSCKISLVHLDTQDFFSYTMNVFHFLFLCIY